MSGDAQGRVNILHLVIVYVFLPVTSLLISILSLLFGRGLNLAVLSSEIPFWGNQLKRSFLLQKQTPRSRLSFFYQSQLAALAFSISGLSVFFTLLVSSDINFVWRSTLLSAEFIYSLLNWLATPWEFWQGAQPSLDLLKQTQDSRLLQDYSNVKDFGQWWQFILAAQVFYAFFLRGLTATVCKVILLKNRNIVSLQSLKNSRGTRANRTNLNQTLNLAADAELAEVVYHVESDFSLNNWCGLEQKILSEVEKKIHQSSPLFSKRSELEAGPFVSHSAQMVSERWQDPQLLIVKGWEPPLAELSDFMQNGQGYLLPMDWNEGGLQSLDTEHLAEWRRFILPLSNWKLLQLERPCD